MNLFEQTFFNRRNWILENLTTLELNLEEAMCVLLIDYYNEFHRTVDISSLSMALKLDGGRVDEILNQLVAKGYLNVELSNRKMNYRLDGLYLHTQDSKPCDTNAYRNLFELYEQEFKRPISQKESEVLSDWIASYDLKLIEYALREAIIYEKISFAYIDTILRNWKEKGMSASIYEERQ